jgi:hypothetical protein
MILNYQGFREPWRSLGESNPCFSLARRTRKATADRILTMLHPSLNRAFHADRVSSDTVWRKVKPFKRVDEAVMRYLSAAEAQRLVSACPRISGSWSRRLCLPAGYAGLARRKCGDFNPDSGTLAIRLSNGRARHVVLTDEAKEFEGWTSGRTTAAMISLRAGGDPCGHFASEAPLGGG